MRQLRRGWRELSEVKVKHDQKSGKVDTGKTLSESFANFAKFSAATTAQQRKFPRRFEKVTASCLPRRVTNVDPKHISQCWPTLPASLRRWLVSVRILLGSRSPEPIRATGQSR